MNKALQTLRKKMEKFNAWETEYLKNTNMDKRFEQFLLLYDLGKKKEDISFKIQHKEHLDAIIEIHLRCRKKWILVNPKPLTPEP